MRRLFFLALLMGYAVAHAQEKEMIDLQPGVTTAEALREKLYTYPQFAEGIVLFKNGKSGKSKLNYSLLTKEMLYISPQRDTLALSDENTIDLISIGKDTFYYNGKYFIQQAKNYGWAKVAQFKSIKEVDRKKSGAYGETISGSAVSLTSMNVSRLMVDLSSIDKVTLMRETKYFISNGTGQFIPLTKNNVLKLIPAQKLSAAYRYLNTNEVDFTVFSQVDRFLTAIDVPQLNM